MSEELLTKALIGDDSELNRLFKKKDKGDKRDKKEKREKKDDALDTLSLLSSLIKKLIKHDECLSEYYASAVLKFSGITSLFVDERKRVDKLMCIFAELKSDYIMVKEAQDCKLTSIFSDLL